MSPPQILKHLISSVVSLAQLVSPSVALPAELVSLYLQQILPYQHKTTKANVAVGILYFKEVYMGASPFTLLLNSRTYSTEPLALLPNNRPYSFMFLEISAQNYRRHCCSIGFLARVTSLYKPYAWLGVFVSCLPFRNFLCTIA